MGAVLHWTGVVCHRIPTLTTRPTLQTRTSHRAHSGSCDSHSAQRSRLLTLALKRPPPYSQDAHHSSSRRVFPTASPTASPHRLTPQPHPPAARCTWTGRTCRCTWTGRWLRACLPELGPPALVPPALVPPALVPPALVPPALVPYVRASQSSANLPPASARKTSGGPLSATRPSCMTMIRSQCMMVSSR